MKCEECLIFIEEHDELDLAMAGEAAAHLDTCAACRELYEEERREQEIYARYLLAVKPDPVMWEKLEAGIKREPSAPRNFLFHNWTKNIIEKSRANFALPIAATVLLVVGITFIVNHTKQPLNAPRGEAATHTKSEVAEREHERLISEPTFPNERADGLQIAKSAKLELHEHEQSDVTYLKGMRTNKRGALSLRGGRNVARHPLPPRRMHEVTPDELVSDAERLQLRAIAILALDIATRRPELDAAKVVQYEEALVIIDRTIKDSRLAVRANPNDPVAVQHMLAAYGKKIDVLEEMASDLD